MILGSLYGFFSLYRTSGTFEHTVAVVQRIDTRKVYRHRKIRYESEMLLAYPTERYGMLYTSQRNYWPFRETGDRLSLLYDPKHPRNIRLSGAEIFLWSVLLIVGGILSAFACFIYKKYRKSITLKREEYE